MIDLLKTNVWEPLSWLMSCQWVVAFSRICPRDVEKNKTESKFVSQRTIHIFKAFQTYLSNYANLANSFIYVEKYIMAKSIYF